MGQHVTKGREAKQRRRETAAARQEAYDKLTDQQKLDQQLAQGYEGKQVHRLRHLVAAKKK